MTEHEKMIDELNSFIEREKDRARQWLEDTEICENNKERRDQYNLAMFEVRQVQSLRRYLEKKDFEKAVKKTREMETFVRDGIPDEVYSYIFERETSNKQVVKFNIRPKGKQKKKPNMKMINDGIYVSGEFHFPENATRDQIAMSLCRKDLYEEFFEIEIMEPELVANED